MDLGPQFRGDGAFTARMRRHQSWWRAAILKRPCGTGPLRASGRRLGSMLTAEDGASGTNFLTGAINAVAARRMSAGPGVEPFRCRHNLLSSQPMCFNLFGPLVEDPDLATTFIRTLPGVDVERVEGVEIEYRPATASALLGDLTSFDAFIAYTESEGGRAFVGIEVKLTEPFSPGRYWRRAYDELCSLPGSPFRVGTQRQLADPRWNQLWRNHLLVEAHRQPPAPDGTKGMLALVRHPLDERCEGDARHYRSLLTEPGAFLDWPLDMVIDRWLDVAPDRARPWLEAFRLRYLDLDVSGS